jgi:hypothetical protein
MRQRQSNEDFGLICVSFYFEKYDPFTICFVYFAFLTTAFAMICDLQQYYDVLGGYLAPRSIFWGPYLNPKISKEVRDTGNALTPYIVAKSQVKANA